MASTYELIIKAVDQTKGPLRQVERSLGDLERQASRVKLSNHIGSKQAAGAGALAGAITRVSGPLLAVGAAAASAGVALNAVINATKDFQRVENGLRLITNNTQELSSTMAKLRTIAGETRTSFDATADLYTKLVIASDELGVSQEEVAIVTTNLSKALAVAGADGATTASVIRQFSQAMASGTVRGDEFNSLVEGLGPALSIMAKETGINVGELRRMSQAGELTAKVMFDMLKETNSLNEAFGQMKPTIDSLETEFGNAFDRMLVNIGKATGAVSLFENALENATDISNKISRALEGDAAQSSATLRKEIEKLTTELAEAEKQAELKNLNTALGKTLAFLRGGDNLELLLSLKSIPARIAELEIALQGAIAREKELADQNAKTTQTIKEQANSFQPLMDAVEKVAGEFKTVGQLTGLDKAQSDLLQLETALENFVTAQNKGALAGNEHGNTMMILRRAIDATKLKIQEYNDAVADKANRDAEAAETSRRQTDPLYDLMKQYEENFERLQRVTQAEYELLFAMQRTNGGTDQQRQILKSLGEESGRLAKQLGLVSDHFGDMVATQASDELAQAKKRLDEINQAIATYKNLEPGKTTSLEADALKARQVALEANKTELEEQIDRLLGVETQTKKTTAAIQEHEQAVKRTTSQYGEFLAPLQKSALASAVMENNFKRLNEQFAPGTGGNPQIYKEGLQALADQGFQPAIDKIIEMEAQTYTLGDAIQETMRASSESFSKDLARGLAQGKSSLNSFKDYFNRILEDIAAMVIQKRITDPLVNDIMKFIPGPGTSTGGGSGDIFGQIGDFFGGFFANGGKPPVGKASIVGERGPELFIPRTSGEIVSNEALNMGGGGLTVNFNINAIDSKSGTEFIVEKKKEIVGLITQAQNQRGRQGITT